MLNNDHANSFKTFYFDWWRPLQKYYFHFKLFLNNKNDDHFSLSILLLLLMNFLVIFENRNQSIG